MKFDKKQLTLYAVTDRQWSDSDDAFCAQIEAALQAGVTCLQLREKSLSTADFIALAQKVKPVCAKYNVPFIINDNLEVAQAVQADGLHLGQGDMSATKARETLQMNLGGADEFIIGVSVSTPDQALLAKQQGADYLGVGAVFPTQTKSDAKLISFDTIKSIKQNCFLPLVAIGGISANNISKLAGLPISGVAVVSAIFAHKSTEQVKSATAKLRSLVDNILL